MRAPGALAAGFMYHEVASHLAGTGFQRPRARAWAHTPAAFARQLDAIARTTPPELLPDIDLDAPGRHLLLTFDDGGVSNLASATMLEDRGLRAHFFVVTKLLGQPGFLTGGDVKRLRRNGHLVGTHSHRHPDIFRDLSRRRMLNEWTRSAGVLEDLLGEPCLAASVPGGDISPLVLETAAEAGFRWLFTSEPVLKPMRVGGCWVVGRVQIKRGISPTRVAALADFRGWWRERAVRSLKDVARITMAPLYRTWVRRTAGSHVPLSVSHG